MESETSSGILICKRFNARSHTNKSGPLSFLLSTSVFDLTIVLQPGCVLISLIPSLSNSSYLVHRKDRPDGYGGGAIFFFLKQIFVQCVR